MNLKLIKYMIGKINEVSAKRYEMQSGTIK